MSGESTGPTGRAGTEAVGRVSTGSRRWLVALGVVFWTWLLARWVHDKLMEPGVNLRDREPFVPQWPFESAVDALTGAAAGLGLAGYPLEVLAWLVGLGALAVESMPALADGAWVTIQLTVGSIAFGLVIAVPLAVVRVYGGPVARRGALAYTELIRGTPLLAQLFVVWFGLNLGPTVRELPGVDGPLPEAAVLVAILGFTINSSAYQSEYIRSALESVDPGQMTAARAVGLSKLGAIRHVVLPQGLRLAIPAWTNEFIYIIKYSSLAAFIAVPELFRRARNIGSDTFQFTDIYLVVTVFYVGLVLTAAVLMERVEHRTAIPGLGS